MKLLIFALTLITSIQFAFANDTTKTVQDEVTAILEFCDAMNPVFTYRCTQYKIEEVKYSLNEVTEAEEINWLNNLLSCYPSEDSVRRRPFNRHYSRGFKPNEIRISSVHSDRRYARKVVNCVIKKVSSN